MTEKSSACGCCPECTEGPDCKCDCPDCTCGCCDSEDYCFTDDCCCDCCCGCCDCCGDDAHGESRFVLSAVSSIMGMLFMGILGIMLSVLMINTVWELTVFDPFGFAFLVSCVAGVLAFAGVISLKAGDMTEGILFTLTGFTMLVGFGGILYGFLVVTYIEWILAAFLLVIALVLLIGRDTTFGIAVSLFFTGLMFSFIYGSDIVATISGIAFLASGIVLMYVAISDWLFVEEGIDLPIL